MRDFKNYQVWEKAHHLTLKIYNHTLLFPNDEQYGLVSQMRRASYSIPSNIAEGCGRDTDAEFSRYLQIASGSANELEYFILLSTDLNYIDKKKAIELTEDVQEIKKMLTKLKLKIKSDNL